MLPVGVCGKEAVEGILQYPET